MPSREVVTQLHWALFEVTQKYYMCGKHAWLAGFMHMLAGSMHLKPHKHRNTSNAVQNTAPTMY